MPVEIYTKTFCPYCWRAKQLLEDKGVEYREISVDFGGPRRREDGRARERPHDRSADLHRRDACRRLRRPFALERAGELDELIAAGRDSNRPLPVDHRHRSGGERAGADRRDRTGGGGRRGDVVHAGNVRASRPRIRAGGEVLRRRMRTRCWRPRGRQRRTIASGSTSARSRCWPRTVRSPTAASSSIAKARSGRPTTRSTCSTSTCRPARAGGIRTSIRRARASCWSTERRSGRSA